MKIVNCKTNHLVNPIAYDMEQLVLTWVVEESKSSKQTYARVRVYEDQNKESLVHDSGERKEIDGRAYEPGIELKPYTRYFWEVEVEGNLLDRATSEMNYFETGKMKEEWTASWITTAWEDQKISPYVRKRFQVNKVLKQARLYIIGLGLYEAHMNGERIGNELLTPYCNAYDAWLQYQAYDVSNQIQRGENMLGVLLGNGWAKGRFGTFGEMNTTYIDDFALRCELHLNYEDGSFEIIGTDESWTSKPAPILEDSIYNGEIFDANRISEDWADTKSDNEGWEKVRSYEPKGLGPIVDRMSPPVMIKEEIKPIELIHTPAGEWVLDMGQNMVGWLRCKIKEPKGAKIVLSHGEVMQEGNFYRDNLREAKAQYTYISDGKEAVVEPHFTFYGFRYVKLEGFRSPIDLNDFIGCVIYSDLDTIGHIETSDPLVNRLFLNALWGQKGNFLDVPTDCPQRDERMGWTGDAQVFSGTASFNMDTYAFYVKFMRDLYEEQKFSGGMVASTVPTFTQNKHSEASFIGGGACAWSDAATVIPWEVYLHTGDASILKRQYDSMKSWVDWIIKKDQESGDRKLWTVGFHFGDWLALDGPVEGGVMGGTDNGLLASAYYRLSTNILSKTAKALGFAEDEKYYGERSEQIKRAIQDEFFSKNGRSTIQTQTAHVVALHFDLVEEQAKKRVVNDLKALLKKSQMHLKTGFIGTPYLCRSLSDNDASDEAYQLFLQEDYPSWLYEVIMGATTIWERWNSILPDGKISGTGMNSLNHYAYGSIMEWVYRNVCGIKPLEEAPGFKQFIIRPEANGRMRYAKASLYSSMGQIESGWELAEDGSLCIKVKVPFDTRAKIYLRDAKLSEVKGLEQILSSEQFGSEVVIEVESGNYAFCYQPTLSYQKKYSLATPLWEIEKNEATREVLKKYAPHLVESSSDKLGMEFPYSIADVLASGDGFMLGMALRGMDVEGYAKEIEELSYPRR
ncbi:MAG: family 78 glycoside hydrolase catalytic domain [Vallitaleaceae bacterium]|nr:family 78 glycoside hydrolase catalytic domain [Vallitaleaceae bacterium]